MFKSPETIPKELAFDIKSLKEEKTNMYSHLLGVVFWLFAAPFFIYKVLAIQNSIIQIGLLVYLFSFLMLFLSSSMYHSSYVAKTRKGLRILDHIGIYCFISGSYTAIILMYINNPYGYKVLYALWFATIFGAFYKLFFIGRFRLISTIIYVLMGWAAIFIINQLSDVMPTNLYNWIIYGGITYTLGTIFYINRKIKYNHLIWHLFVLAGAICHFTAIYLSL